MGQTSRPLRTRLAGHRRDYLNRKNMPLYRHLRRPGHSFSSVRTGKRTNSFSTSGKGIHVDGKTQDQAASRFKLSVLIRFTHFPSIFSPKSAARARGGLFSVCRKLIILGHGLLCACAEQTHGSNSIILAYIRPNHNYSHSSFFYH